MMNELEAMRDMIEGHKKVFSRNMDYLVLKLEDLKKIGTAIGEVSVQDCMAAVQREFNDAIEKMMR
jgi:hypothetical protein